MEDVKTLYLVADGVDISIDWEPESDERSILIGVYTTRKGAEAAKKSYDKEYQSCARIVRAPLNSMAKDEKSDTGFVELGSFWSYDDDMYDDPMDI